MSYQSKMKPYAKNASKRLGISWRVILTQWIHETGWGKSSAAKQHNNHAGIKTNSNGRDYDGGTYAGYNSTSSFVDDYVRVMNLSYYDSVRSANGDENQIIALHKSPWATDPNYDNKMFNLYESLDFGNIQGDSSAGGGAGSLTEGLDVGNLSDEELKKYALVGLGFATILAVIK